MSRNITFDDVLIKPKFSKITSRKDVDISSSIGDLKLNLPVISSNMDTVTSIEMAHAMYKYGGIGCLHRFSDINQNVKVIKEILSNNSNAIVSIGLGTYEYDRAVALIEAGAKYVCIDVAHGAQISVVEQFNNLYDKYKDSIGIIVGNFATGDSIKEFRSLAKKEPLAFKVGVGGGSACLTRIQTGCGVPQLSSVIDCVNLNKESNIISDGGKKYPGDIAKALAVGAKAVMLGSMLAGCDESPGELINGKFKKYRGSASQESYEVQGKVAQWRTFEGDSFLVPYKGSVEKILQNIEGGIRSSFSYVGASTMAEFQEKAEIVEISYSTLKENFAHGKNQIL